MKYISASSIYTHFITPLYTLTGSDLVKEISINTYLQATFLSCKRGGDGPGTIPRFPSPALVIRNELSKFKKTKFSYFHSVLPPPISLFGRNTP